MASPIPFSRNPQRTATQAETETDDQIRARHRETLREMAELGMRNARTATDRIERNERGPGDAEPSPSLTFARATHAVRQAIALEQRSLAATPMRPRPAPPFDARRPPLRHALRTAAESEPDRAARTQLYAFIDERIDADLRDDPEGLVCIAELLFNVSEELGLTLDVAKLSNEVLGIAPVPRQPPENPHRKEPAGPEPPIMS